MSDATSRRQSVPVSALLDCGEALGFRLVAGSKGVSNSIREAAINRPGLAMTGFFKYFARRRVQIVGYAEHTYLGHLTAAERSERLRAFFGSRIPCVILSRGLRPYPEMQTLADEYRVPLIRCRGVTMHVINSLTLLLENLMAPRMRIQGTMLEIMGIGVLIEGPPGIGKSDAALSLLRKGYALVSDDITSLRVDSAGAVIAGPIDVTRYHMEIRGVGIIHVPSLFGVASVREEKRLDLIVTLCREDQRQDEIRGGEPRPQRDIMGVRVPHIHVAVTPGRDLANILEAAALDMKLKRLGHDAEKELDQRLIDELTRGRSAPE